MSPQASKGTLYLVRLLTSFLQYLSLRFAQYYAGLLTSWLTQGKKLYCTGFKKVKQDGKKPTPKPRELDSRIKNFFDGKFNKSFRKSKIFSKQRSKISLFFKRLLKNSFAYNQQFCLKKLESDIHFGTLEHPTSIQKYIFFTPRDQTECVVNVDYMALLHTHVVSLCVRREF